MTDILNKDYIKSYSGMVETDSLPKSGKNGHTYPLFFIDGDKRFSPESFVCVLRTGRKVVKADTAGYHAYCQSKYCFGFPVTTLSFLDLDSAINHMRQTEPMDKFIYKESSAMTDKCFVLFKNDLCSLGSVNLFDLLHLHPPGDKDEDILHYEETFVYG